MKFTPKTDKEIQEMNLIPEGTYLFEVFNAEEKLSQNNNPMIKLVLTVIVDGKKRPVNDQLMECFPKKLKNFFDTVGLTEKYTLGELEPKDCFGKRGKVEIFHKPDDKGNKWANVKDYIVGEPIDTSVTPDLIDNDIPF